jgi:hypothetical protein
MWLKNFFYHALVLLNSLFSDSIDYLASRDRICLLADKFFGLLELRRFTLFFVISRKDFGASRSASYNFQFAGISPY